MKKIKAIEPKIPIWDSRNFDKKGIHKATGTKYNPEGFNRRSSSWSLQLSLST